MLIILILCLLIRFCVVPKMTDVPHGVQNALETAVEFVAKFTNDTGGELGENLLGNGRFETPFQGAGFHCLLQAFRRAADVGSPAGGLAPEVQRDRSLRGTDYPQQFTLRFLLPAAETLPDRYFLRHDTHSPAYVLLRPGAQPFSYSCDSGLMSILQPVSLAARRAF